MKGWAVEAAGAADAQTDARPQLLGRRQTDAGAHSYHKPARLGSVQRKQRAILATTCLGPDPWWPVLTRPRVAGFQVSPEG